MFGKRLINTGGSLGWRYWRYIEGSAVEIHHPRVSRIDFINNSGSTRLITYTSDNCSDSGDYAIGTVSIDLGAGNEDVFTNASIYSVFGAVGRSANVEVQYSEDNTNWETAFSIIMGNYAYPSGSSSCGLFNGYLI